MFSSKAERKIDLQWSPFNNEEFLLHNTDICVYKLKNTKSKASDIEIYNETYVDLFASYNENSNPRIVSWYWGLDNHYMFAATFANQKILLINLNKTSLQNPTSKKTLEIKKELNLKQVRQCNNLTWNPIRTNLLAVGFEKNRIESSVLIWDMKAIDSNDMKSIFSTATSEIVNSLSWHPTNENSLLVGLSYNSLRIYDIRGTSMVKTNTKYVYGFSMDPITHHNAASYLDREVALWDVRKFDQPFDTIQMDSDLVKIQWCRTKYGKLATLNEQSNEINIYAIKPENVFESKTEYIPYVKPKRYDKIDRICPIPTKSNQNISNLKSFCWHNFDPYKILTADNSTFKLVCLSDARAMSWSGTGEFCWTSANGRINIAANLDIDEQTYKTELKERAKYDYGMKYEVIQNGLVKCDFLHNIKSSVFNTSKNDLKFLWSWFDSVNRLFDSNMTTSKLNFHEYFYIRYHGLLLMFDEFTNKKYYFEQNEAFEKFKTITFNLCGWDYKDGAVTKQFFTNLEINGQFERAICLTILLNRSESALEEIFEKAFVHDNAFGSIWISLKLLLDENKIKSEKQDDNKATSKQGPTKPKLNDSIKLADQFTNPYMRTVFKYVLARDESIKDILNDDELLFQDRLALSIHFLALKNNELKNYLTEMLTKSINMNTFNMKAIIITGLSMSSIDLFQTYIDRTYDIQTVSLAIIHSTFQEVLNNQTVTFWINSYRDRLNQEMLWEKRAEYDIFKMKLTKSNQLHLQLLKFDHDLKNNNINEPILSNSSSSSSLSSTLLATTSPVLVNTSTNSTQNITKHTYHTYPLMHGQQHHQQTQINININSQSQAIHNLCLICNNCGKNMFEKTSIAQNTTRTHTNSLSLLTTHHHSIHSNTQYTNNDTNDLNDDITTSTSSVTLQSDDNSIKTFKPPNMDSLIGCLNCKKFLPQCTICLGYMSINIQQQQTQNSNNRLLHQSNSHQSPKSSQFVQQQGNSNLKLSSSVQSAQSLTIASDTNSTNVNFINNENYIFLSNTKFGSWFTWCQSCKHGGHAKHLYEWFSQHEKCAFPHCRCQCLSIDKHLVSH